jgi:hypothetical protein
MTSHHIKANKRKDEKNYELNKIKFLLKLNKGNKILGTTRRNK